MKAWMLTSLFLTVPALACPGLSGEYKTCRVVSTSQTKAPARVFIEQKTINSTQQYKFTITDEDQETRSELYTADGKARVMTNTDSDTGITMKTRTTATCASEVLTVKMDATIDGELLADITMKVSKSNNQLVQIYEGQSMGEPVNDTVICQ